MLVLPNDVAAIRRALGLRIVLATAADLTVERSSRSGLAAVHAAERTDAVFYHFGALTLLLERGSNSFWLALDSGPDAPGEPWGSIRAWEAQGPVVKGPWGRVQYENATFPEVHSDSRPARLQLWPNEPLDSVELLALGLQGAVIGRHSGGFRWCVHVDYEDDAWLCFDRAIIDAVRGESNERQFIRAD